MSRWLRSPGRLAKRGERIYGVSMVVELKPETERLLQEELSKGHFESVDEIILRGIGTRLGRPLSDKPRTESLSEIGRKMREDRKHNVLPPGVTIKQLIEEGRD